MHIVLNWRHQTTFERSSLFARDFIATDLVEHTLL